MDAAISWTDDASCSAEPATDTGCPADTFSVRTVKFAPSPGAHWAPAWDVAFMVLVP